MSINTNQIINFFKKRTGIKHTHSQLRLNLFELVTERDSNVSEACDKLMKDEHDIKVLFDVIVEGLANRYVLHECFYNDIENLMELIKDGEREDCKTVFSKNKLAKIVENLIFNHLWMPCTHLTFG